MLPCIQTIIIAGVTMLITIATAAVIFGFCGAFHFWVMTRCTQFLNKAILAPGTRRLIGLYVAGMAHKIEAIVYAFGFLFLRGLGLGAWQFFQE